MESRTLSVAPALHSWSAHGSRRQTRLCNGKNCQLTNKTVAICVNGYFLFVQIFTLHYGQLMHDFIFDDHDHSHSVTSLSVQLFTVPTLAQYLMAHHEALAALLRCFLTEIERRKNFEGRLSFDRSQNQQSFRRAMYVLYDIKYLLSAVPLPEQSDEGAQTDMQAEDVDSTSGRWSDPLRKGFLQGLHMLLSLLASMEVCPTFEM